MPKQSHNFVRRPESKLNLPTQQEVFNTQPDFIQVPERRSEQVTLRKKAKLQLNKIQSRQNSNFTLLSTHSKIKRETLIMSKEDFDTV